jgi:protein phosphatase
VQKDARAAVLRLAKEQNCLAVAIVLDTPEKICRERNEKRSDRNVGALVISRQAEQLRRSIRGLQREGFRYVYILSGEEIENAEIIRTPLWNNKKTETGPFDIIGDIHGCYDELCELLTELKYEVDAENFCAKHPDNRKAVFLGDLCDRGPKNVEVIRLVCSRKP